MFNIPDIHRMNLSFTDAEYIMSRHSSMGITIIECMENLLSEWDQHCNGCYFFADDDEFFEFFQYEANAFNVLYREMKHLFRYGL